MSLVETVLEVTNLFNLAQIDFLIGGSLASSAWGQERSTHDADIAAFVNTEQLKKLSELISWPYQMDTETIQEQLLNLQDFASGQILNCENLDKIDLFLLGGDEYSKSQLLHRRYLEITPGHPLPFASPEDTIISKLRWYVLGNKVSDRQWNDIVQVLEMQNENLDQNYLSHWCTFFGLTELLISAQSQIKKL